ncbi:glutamyl-tRNA reductase [Moraxella ovis]|uniref:glutamyl-tRNA reductase n=1 Tax=Moraxella ovis TaxID=29433 RepID=UPI000D9893A2|nr:glutamyl-tRNA reductase [Moraxella ovis]SPX85387.1 Glutamyl-tRNA reductase [Moraxella ovis]STZ06310.1 Glutamyl-tRNA reductase [Moraxella ovis]
MKLAVVGVNHKTAPVELREKLSFGQDLSCAIDELKAITDGSVIVSTCNRSEIYVKLPDDAVYDDELEISDAAQRVRAWLAQFKGLNLDDIAPFLYIYEDNRALNHWLRVAAGLDSMILGEPQILGQIRQAAAQSRESGGMGRGFDWLTQQVFAAARAVRRDTKVGAQAVTLGFATAKLVTQIFDEPSRLTFMLVAAGEMNRLVAHNVAALGMGRIIIANRSKERAENLAAELHEMAKAANRSVQIDLVPLTELGAHIADADVISSCSGSMDALITHGMVKAALKARRHRPMLMVDLAVPRDIEPSVGSFDDVYLYSVDDLQHVIAGNLEERKQAAIEAELMVSQLVLDIEHQMQVQTARTQITAYRQTAENHKERLLNTALARLSDGDDAAEVVKELARTLTQTLTHAPSKLIRHTAQNSEADVLEMVTHALNHAYRD